MHTKIALSSCPLYLLPTRYSLPHLPCFIPPAYLLLPVKASAEDVDHIRVVHLAHQRHLPSQGHHRVLRHHGGRGVADTPGPAPIPPHARAPLMPVPGLQQQQVGVQELDSDRGSGEAATLLRWWWGE